MPTPLRTRAISRRLSAWLAGGLIVVTSATALALEPMDYVKKQTEEVTAVLQQPDSDARTARLEKVLQGAIDFRELAARALGEHWSARTPEEQEEFLSLLQQLLQANYATKLQGQRLGEDYTISYVAAAKRNDKAIVKTAIVVEDVAKPIDYKLIKKGDDWSVYDVVIDDISLEETYRDSYTRIIENEGWAALIGRMKERVRETEKAAAKQSTAEK